MTRTERLLRLAKLRGDRAAAVILDARLRKPVRMWMQHHALTPFSGSWMTPYKWDQLAARETESELRALWGDR